MTSLIVLLLTHAVAICVGYAAGSFIANMRGMFDVYDDNHKGNP